MDAEWVGRDEGEGGGMRRHGMGGGGERAGRGLGITTRGGVDE